MCAFLISSRGMGTQHVLKNLRGDVRACLISSHGSARLFWYAIIINTLLPMVPVIYVKADISVQVLQLARKHRTQSQVKHFHA